MCIGFNRKTMFLTFLAMGGLMQEEAWCAEDAGGRSIIKFVGLFVVTSYKATNLVTWQKNKIAFMALVWFHSGGGVDWSTEVGVSP